MDPVTILAVTSLILSVAGATTSAVSSYQNAKIQQREAQANVQQAEYEAQMERNAEAMNATKTRRDARARIAAAKAKYAAYGNIGESADATIEDAYVNLASDLSALHFNSENRAIQSENAALMYNFNSKVAKRNKTSAVIGGTLNVLGSAASSTVDGYKIGGFGSKTNAAGAKVSGIKTDASGMYGRY